MILSVHQPIFMPWPGLFHKAVHADCLVLLDDVQFPRGRSWLNRNRLKNEDGELWLTVPVWKKGRGLQLIRQVEIYHERGWWKKHIRSIEQNYTHATFSGDYFSAIANIYQRHHSLLIELNLDLIRFFWGAMQIETRLVRQSELGVVGTGTDLLIKICEKVGARSLLIFPMVKKHIDQNAMQNHGIELVFANFRPLVYPQLWGDFIYNLSTLDLLLNCGPKCREIVAGPVQSLD